MSRMMLTASSSMLRSSRLLALNQAVTTSLSRPIVTAIPAFKHITLRRYSRLVDTVLKKHSEAFTEDIRPLTSFVSHLTRAAPSKSQSAQRPEYRPAGAAEPAEKVRLSDEDAASEAAKSKLSTELRFLMRRVPHPVAIITATNPQGRSPKDAFRGMTVSTFNTLSLFPEPIICFNVKTPSETYNAVQSSKRFLVHLLSPKAATARLARDFARGNENLHPDNEEAVFDFVSSHIATDSNKKIAIAEGEPPMLILKGHNASQSLKVLAEENKDQKASSDPDFPFVLECQTLPQTVRMGEHVVVLGRVKRIIRPGIGEISEGSTELLAQSHESHDLCLSYADTRFWQMGRTIDTKTKAEKGE